MIRALRFRVQNYRNINDSGWIPLERVTNFVGRNESGKTTLLKAFHKFNPATPEPYDPQREFPRDRYTRDYIAGGAKGGDWPVCSVAFALPEEVKIELAAVLTTEQHAPDEAILTRYYDGSLSFEYEPALREKPLTPEPVLKSLEAFAAAARRIPAPSAEQEEAAAAQRSALSTWAIGWQDRLKAAGDLRNEDGAKLLNLLRGEAEKKSSPQTADMVEALQADLAPLLDAAKIGPVLDQIDAIIEDRIPVLVYFENYGILDSAIWLPRFLEDRKRAPADARIRTIDAMFRHVGLDPQDIASLGNEEAETQRRQGHQPTAEMISNDQRRKEARAIQLNSASLDISAKFSNWWSQRRHKIRYHADGDYFRIWVADDRRPDVEIELEARSKGFQWFFSFYLVFLVESGDGHKDAILLLDEPGMHLHPTAQQELIGFFETLAEKNQLLYSTHSPFLIDGEHLHRVRPVTEDNAGNSHISVETWPKDRETIFPLQAAAGYAMARGLFQHHKNVLVEGMSDYYYLHALAHQCVTTNRMSLPTDIYVTPCGGTKLVSQFASLFLGQEVRPLILLDGDDAGRVRRDALMKEMYIGHDSAVLMLDEVLGRPGDEIEVEDILGEALILPALKVVIGKSIKLTELDRKAGSLPSMIKSAAKRLGIELPEGWKASVAIQLVSEWAEKKTTLPTEVLARAEMLFRAISERFRKGS
ncbi:putative AbiEii toxin of type IV toxin-antitoxin system [Dongia mobilis]|uniref:Putative AbiEii toxin of type IV toxin-antitoxin system n=1 Tax=Dongia mobilis TaxID=578943 RepID=A0A4R6WXM7_9PROT|nr:AAA family ATPase [Dongia mobilis]TDQ84457.1 putative AbiEii toxin of type IV toxin-antitoxin system [Dongia mobilis]